MGPLDAYLTGVQHTLLAAAWLAGALSVVVCVVALFAAVLTLTVPVVNRARTRVTSWRLHRHARRSGRYPQD